MLDALQQKRNRANGQSGFTIIEVLIVLAIAGLIMVIVFLAIPNLQRSQRNTSRKSDANNVLSAISDYVSNNGGTAPAAACAGSNCTFISAASGVKIGYFDTTPANNKILYYPTFASMPAVVTTAGASTPANDTLWIVNGATCSGGPTAAPTAGTSRQLAAVYGIEGSVGIQCISE